MGCVSNLSAPIFFRIIICQKGSKRAKQKELEPVIRESLPIFFLHGTVLLLQSYAKPRPGRIFAHESDDSGLFACSLYLLLD